eukprot:1381769-Alexandrium_andersonii.AAC.1
MDRAGRVLVDEVTQAVLALQAAAGNSAPRCPFFRAYVQPLIDDLRNAAGRASLAEAAAVPTA